MRAPLITNLQTSTIRVISGSMNIGDWEAIDDSIQQKKWYEKIFDSKKSVAH